MITARVFVRLKPEVLDTQGETVQRSLTALGFASVSRVRQGKFFEIALDDSDPVAARSQLDAICRTLLANLVIEDYAIEVTDAGDGLAWSA